VLALACVRNLQVVLVPSRCGRNQYPRVRLTNALSGESDPHGFQEAACAAVRTKVSRAPRAAGTCSLRVSSLPRPRRRDTQGAHSCAGARRARQTHSQANKRARGLAPPSGRSKTPKESWFTGYCGATPAPAPGAVARYPGGAVTLARGYGPAQELPCQPPSYRLDERERGSAGWRAAGCH